MSTVQIKIGPAERGRRMTLDEFIEAEEEPGYLYELARGVLEVTQVPNDPHAQIVHNIHEAFSQLGREHPGLIYWIGHGSDIRLRIPEMTSDRHPDLGVVFRGTRPDEKGRRRPRLVVEVVSAGKAARARDYVAKSEEYLALGILEYWIVDPAERQVTVSVRRESATGPSWSSRTFRDGERVASPLLPDFDHPVADLWSDVEGVAEDELEE